MSSLKLAAVAVSIAAAGAAIMVLESDTKTESRDRHAEQGRRADRARSPRRTPPRTRLAGTDSAELSDLRHQVRQLTAEVEQAPAEMPPAPPPGDPDLDSEPASNEDAAALTAEVFDERIAAQTHDPEATHQAQSHIATVIGESEAGGRLLDLDCGAELCRGQLAFDDVGQRDACLRDVGGLMPWDADGFFRSDPEDATRVSLYFTRPGTTLPGVGEES